MASEAIPFGLPRLTGSFKKNGMPDSGKTITECWNVDIVKLNKVTFSVNYKL